MARLVRFANCFFAIYIFSVLSTNVAADEAAPENDPGAFKEFEAELVHVKRMTGEFAYYFDTEKTTVTVSEMTKRIQKEREKSSGPMADMLDGLLDRLRQGDYSAITDYDPQVAYVDEEKEVVVYDSQYMIHAIVDGNKYRLEEEIRRPDPKRGDRVDTEVATFDGAQHARKLVSRHRLSAGPSRPFFTSSEGSPSMAGLDGLSSQDPRLMLILPMVVTVSYGGFTYSRDESTKELYVYTKTLADEKTGLPRFWARIWIEPGFNRAVLYREGPVKEGKEVDGSEWKATYSQNGGLDPSVPETVAVELRSAKWSIHVTEWKDFSRTGLPYPDPSTFQLSR